MFVLFPETVYDAGNRGSGVDYSRCPRYRKAGGHEERQAKDEEKWAKHQTLGSTMDQNNVELASVAHWFTHDPDEAVVFTLRALPLFEIILKSSGSLFVTFRVGFEWPSMQ